MATEKITAIVDSIAELSVLELKELKETIEETFGVTAAAVAVAAAPAEGGNKKGHSNLVERPCSFSLHILFLLLR